MKSHRALLLCIFMTMAAKLGTGHAWGQTKDELLQLVQSYRAKITDMDVSFTCAGEALAEDPVKGPHKPFPKIMNRIKQQGTLYLNDSLRFRNEQQDSIHMITTHDGEKVTVYDVDGQSASIAPPDGRIASGNWVYKFLKWPQQPTPSAHSDLLILIASRKTTVLAEKEMLFGTEMVVLDHAGQEKVWLDVEHGGIVRKNEWRHSAGGPLSRRSEIPELHDVNGVFLPAKLVQTAFTSNENPEELWNIPVWRITMSIPKETLKINLGLTKEDFQLDLPPGTHVYDGIAETEYTVGETTSR